MLRKLIVSLVLAVLLPTLALGESVQEALKKLEELGIPFTQKEFIMQVQKGDRATVDLFLAAGMNPNVKDYLGFSVLMSASLSGYTDIVKLLLDNGAAIESLISTPEQKEEFLRSSGSFVWLAGPGIASSGENQVVEILSPDMYQEIKIEQEGSFGGLGLVINLNENKDITVGSLIKEAPALRSGVYVGDKIIEIGNESIRGLPLEDIVRKLRGPINSQVTITVLRDRGENGDGSSGKLEFTLTRSEIKIPSVKWGILDGGIGYIRLSEFNKKTANDLQKAIEGLMAKRMRSMVIDLRNNSGGLLSAASDVAGEFLEKGQLIAYTLSRYGLPSQRFETKAEMMLDRNIPVVILVNGGTGGASEMVVGALRDYGRVAILGEKTAGGACIRNSIVLSNGSVLRLITGEFLTPNGNSIERVGITPDIEVKLSLDARKELYESLSIQHNILAIDSKQDVQLQRAWEFLQGYDLSKTLDENITLAKKKFESSSGNE